MSNSFVLFLLLTLLLYGGWLIFRRWVLGRLRPRQSVAAIHRLVLAYCPPEFSLAASPAAITNTQALRQFTQDFMRLGYQEIGDYQAVGVPGHALRCLRHPNGCAFAVIAQIMNRGVLVEIRAGTPELAVVITTEQDYGLAQAPGVVLVRPEPVATVDLVATLHQRFADIARNHPQLQPVEATLFPQIYLRAYGLNRRWRAQVGYQRREIEQVAQALAVPRPTPQQIDDLLAAFNMRSVQQRHNQAIQQFLDLQPQHRPAYEQGRIIQLGDPLEPLLLDALAEMTEIENNAERTHRVQRAQAALRRHYQNEGLDGVRSHIAGLPEPRPNFLGSLAEPRTDFYQW